jgi:hypothetical protein
MMHRIPRITASSARKLGLPVVDVRAEAPRLKDVARVPLFRKDVEASFYLNRRFVDQVLHAVGESDRIVLVCEDPDSRMSLIAAGEIGNVLDVAILEGGAKAWER